MQTDFRSDAGQYPNTAGQGPKSAELHSTESANEHLSGHSVYAVADAARKLKAEAKLAEENMMDRAVSAGETAKDYAGKLALNAAQGFSTAVETGKSASADAISSVARSARDAADGFEKQSPQVARMVRSVAGGAERMSADLRNNTINDLVKSVTDFAQRQPKVFFGCGILAGLVLSRLLRGSSEA